MRRIWKETLFLHFSNVTTWQSISRASHQYQPLDSSLWTGPWSRQSWQTPSAMSFCLLRRECQKVRIKVTSNNFLNSSWCMFVWCMYFVFVCNKEFYVILNYKRLCPCVCKSHHFIISDLNTPSQCSNSELHI